MVKVTLANLWFERPGFDSTELNLGAPGRSHVRWIYSECTQIPAIDKFLGNLSVHSGNVQSTWDVMETVVVYWT